MFVIPERLCQLRFGFSLKVKLTIRQLKAKDNIYRSSRPGMSARISLGKRCRSAIVKTHQKPQRNSFTYKGKDIANEKMTRYAKRHPSLDVSASPAPCELDTFVLYLTV